MNTYSPTYNDKDTFIHIMTRILLYITFISFFVMTFISCSGRGDNNSLKQAESLMQENPDSALSILESIDAKSIKRDKDFALYGLLYTQALDKTYNELNTDSLISVSVEFYGKSNDRKKLIESLYYQGRCKFLKGNYPSALISYLKAMELAEDMENNFYIGMSSRGVSDIYAESFNAADELEYAKKEYENLKTASAQPYLNYSLLDLSRAYHNNQEYDKVHEIVRELSDSAYRSDDYYLYENGLRMDASAYMGENRYAEAFDIYSSMYEQGIMNTEDSIYMAMTYAWLGNIQAANNILNTVNSNDSILHSLSAYHIAKIQGNLPKALHNLEKLSGIANESFKKRIDMGLTTFVYDYYHILNNQTKIELKTSRMWTRLYIITGTLICSIIAFIAVYIIKRQKKKTLDKVIFAEQLQEMLRQSKVDNEAAANTIKYLTSNQYKLLKELCEIVSTTPDSKKARKKIADTVTNLINDLSVNGKKIQDFGKVVDETYDNLYADFRRDLPNLKEEDYCLYIFTVLGFSNIAISLFLKVEKVNSIYDRKRRLKDKIKQLDKEKSERYLRPLT